MFSSVKWSSCWSVIFSVSFGVRRGSVLSPVLFAVYIDDICKLYNVIHGTPVVLYADVHEYKLKIKTSPRSEGRLVTLHLTICPLTSDFPIPSPPLNAALKPTYVNSFRSSLPPSSHPSDCLRPRFSRALTL